MLPTLPLHVQVIARNIVYIPDIVGPTDPLGRPLQPPSSSSSGSNLASNLASSLGSNGGSSGCSSLASSADAPDELVMTDGSGFISQDLAELVPAVSAGELTAAMFGQGLFWPNTPLQVSPECGLLYLQGKGAQMSGVQMFDSIY